MGVEFGEGGVPLLTVAGFKVFHCLVVPPHHFRELALALLQGALQLVALCCLFPICFFGFIEELFKGFCLLVAAGKLASQLRLGVGQEIDLPLLGLNS